jgi:PTS system ascorbate-specific IIB component
MARRMRIVTVCGCGLGSSLLAKTILEKIAREYGVKTAIVAADAGTAKGHASDLIVAQDHLAPRVGEVPGVPVLAVKSFIDKDELKALLGDYFKEYAETGKITVKKEE